MTPRATCWIEGMILAPCLTLTHWGLVTHICVGNLTIIGSDNDLSPGRRQAIIWTNAGISLIGPLGTNFSEILIGIQKLSFKKMPLEMSSAKWHLFGLGLNVLILSTWTSAMAWCLYGAKSPAILVITRAWNQYYTWIMHFYTDVYGRYLFRTIFIIILWGSLTQYVEILRCIINANQQTLF